MVLEIAMSDFQDAQAALGVAVECLQHKQMMQAQAALRDAYQALERHIVADVGFSCLVTIQATLAALQSGDQNTSRKFAALVVEDVARELEELGKRYDQHIATGDRDMARNLEIVAYTYAVAFVPFVKEAGLADLIPGDPDGGPQHVVQIANILRFVRPPLDRAGWDSWDYDPLIKRRARYWAASAIVSMGHTYMDNASSGRRVAQAQQLLTAASELLDDFPPDPLIAEIYNLEARVLSRYGFTLFPKAIDACSNAIAVYEENGNSVAAARDRSMLGALQFQYAGFLTFNGQATEAKQFNLKAERNLLAARAGLSLAKPGRELEAYLQAEINLGAFYAKGKRWDLAADAFNNAWLKTPLTGDQAPTWRPRVAGNFGSALLEQCKLDEAESWLRRALLDVEAVVDPEPDVHMVVHGSLGRLLSVTERAAEGHGHLERAVAKLDTFRSSFLAERANHDLIKSFRWLYEGLVDCCVRLGADQPELRTQAFETAECAKWRTLTVLLRYLPLGLLNAQQEPRVADEERLLRRAESALGEPVLAGTLEMEEVFDQLARIWDELAADHPEYIAFRRQQTIRIEEARHLLDAEVPILVEYYFGDQYATAVAFVIDRAKDAPKAIRLDSSPDEITAMVKRLRDATDERSTTYQFEQAARPLHDTLVAPLLHLLPERVGICIVPYGPLHNLSFAGLHDGKQYLAERNAIVIAPTASALRWWVAKDKGEKRTCLVFTATENIQSGSEDKDDLIWFEHLARKVIAPMFSRTVVVSGKQATKKALSDELSTTPPPDIVHLACHGEFGSNTKENLGFSAKLLLVADEQAMTRQELSDKDLTALEIFTKLRPSASHVTLSACHSAVAETSINDELAGLSHAFLLAGASSVLATVCYVKQGPGVAIAREFYKRWRGSKGQQQGLSKVRALQDAQIRAIRDRKWVLWGGSKWHPQQWSAFQLYGNWK
jgi:CHAT domain-containing protein